MKLIYLNNLFLGAFFLTLFSNCTSNTKSEFSQKINKGSSTIIEEISTKSLIDSTIIIKLETNKKCLIGEIKQIVFFKDYIIVLDNEKANSVFLFNNKGRFLSKIGKYGKGPNEYLALGPLYVEEEKKLICIFDPLKLCVLKYSFSNQFVGKGVDFKNMPFRPDAIGQLGDGKLITYSSSYNAFDNYAMHVIDERGQIKNKFSPHKFSIKNMIYIPYNNYFNNQSNDSIHLIDYLSDTLFTYSIRDQTMKPHLVLNLENKSINKQDINKINKNTNPIEIENEILKKGKNVGVKSIFEGKDHLYYTYRYLNTIKNGIYFKKDNTFILFNGYKNELLIEPIGETIIANDGSYFVSVLNFSNLEKIKNNFEIYRKNVNNKEFMKHTDKMTALNMDFYNVVKKIKLEDNPVLILTKFKKSVAN